MAVDYWSYAMAAATAVVAGASSACSHYHVRTPPPPACRRRAPLLYVHALVPTSLSLHRARPAPVLPLSLAPPHQPPTPPPPPPSSPLPCKLGADARWIQGDEAEQQSMAYNPYIPAGRCSGRPGSSARWGPGAGSSGIAHIHGQGSIHSSHTIGWCMLPRLSSGTG